MPDNPHDTAIIPKNVLQSHLPAVPASNYSLMFIHYNGSPSEHLLHELYHAARIDLLEDDDGLFCGLNIAEPDDSGSDACLLL